MPNIARTNKRPSPPMAASAAKTKILLVRQPVKSVRASDMPDRSALHLAIGVIVALGAVSAIWLLGFLGFELGFAHLMRVPDLQVEAGGGIATGALILLGLPQVILQAGIFEPTLMMAGFALIALPAACLASIKPRTAAEPRPNPAIIALSFMGAIGAAINGCVVIYWSVCGMRKSLIAELPMNPGEAKVWLGNLQTVAGLDALAVIAAALWVVVAMRLPIPRWTRGLAASACFFALVVISVAMSITNASVAQISASRSVVQIDEGPTGPQLLIGSTRQQIATLGMDYTTGRIGAAATTTPQPVSIVELSDRPSRLTIVSRQSVVEYLLDHAPKE